MLVSKNEEFGRLFNELLVILEPLMHIPFSFSIDFELRQVWCVGMHGWLSEAVCEVGGCSVSQIRRYVCVEGCVQIESVEVCV